MKYLFFSYVGTNLKHAVENLLTSLHQPIINTSTALE